MSNRYHAIETKYKGYRFRSKTEARWAAYFDAIGLEWEYEIDGFDLGTTSYMPDFWLPQVEMFAEVKRSGFFNHPKSDEVQAAIAKVALLCASQDTKCLLLTGMPAPMPYLYVYWDYKRGIAEVCDCVISMYHNYPIDEHRFYSNTGIDTKDTYDWFYAPGCLFSDVVPAIEHVRFMRFGVHE